MRGNPRVRDLLFYGSLICELIFNQILLRDVNYIPLIITITQLLTLFRLLLNIDSDSERQIDSAFQSALALCSIDKTSSVDLQLLWWK
jgi:hypothetical protein